MSTKRSQLTPVEPLADRPSFEEAEEAVRTLIRWAGDDPSREGLLETPSRVVRATVLVAMKRWREGWKNAIFSSVSTVLVPARPK